MNLIRLDRAFHSDQCMFQAVEPFPIPMCDCRNSSICKGELLSCFGRPQISSRLVLDSWTSRKHELFKSAFIAEHVISEDQSFFISLNKHAPLRKQGDFTRRYTGGFYNEACRRRGLKWHGAVIDGSIVPVSPECILSCCVSEVGDLEGWLTLPCQQWWEQGRPRCGRNEIRWRRKEIRNFVRARPHNFDWISENAVLFLTALEEVSEIHHQMDDVYTIF